MDRYYFELFHNEYRIWDRAIGAVIASTSKMDVAIKICEALNAQAAQ